jgi:hypothetical protein
MFYFPGIIYLILAACGGKRDKKRFSGTPRTPAKGYALCTPDLRVHGYLEPLQRAMSSALPNREFMGTLNPGRGQYPLHSQAKCPTTRTPAKGYALCTSKT